MNLFEKLAIHKNNYTTVDLANTKIPDVLTASFVIPSYNSESTLKVVLKTIADQTEIARVKEVIIIDDLSEDSTYEMVESMKISYPTNLVYIKNEEKLYAGQSRNLGIEKAIGDIIFFLDSDIAIPTNYVGEHLKVHASLANAFAFSFRSYIDQQDFIEERFQFPITDYNNEFRLARRISQDWDLLPEQEKWRGRETKLYEQTDGFRTLSSTERTDFWTLPEVALVGISSVRRDHVLKVGGFDKRFKGWGYEDISFAAKLIGLLDLYAIPVISSSTYHPNHEHRLSDHKTWFQKNLQLYERFLNEETVI